MSAYERTAEITVGRGPLLGPGMSVAKRAGVILHAVRHAWPPSTVCPTVTGPGAQPQVISQVLGAVALARPPAKLGRGIFGAPSKIDLERTLDAELPVEEFEALLEEVRAATGEVGRINETLGRSLSWNSLSFQNSFEGTGRLIHVMVKPKDGKTRIRITENGGVQAVFLAFGTVIGGGVLGVIIGEAIGTISGAVLLGSARFLLPAALFGATWGGLYVGARALFRGFIKRRVRILSELLDRLSDHVTATAPPP